MWKLRRKVYGREGNGESGAEGFEIPEKEPGETLGTKLSVFILYVLKSPFIEILYIGKAILKPRTFFYLLIAYFVADIFYFRKLNKFTLGFLIVTIIFFYLAKEWRSGRFIGEWREKQSEKGKIYRKV